MAINNLLAAEALIIQRITAAIPSLKTVASATILAGAQDIAPYCPAVFVLPGAADPSGDQKIANHAVERQEWQVVVCVANIRDPLDVNTTASIAGPILMQVCMALMGWKPSSDHRALTYRGRGAPFFDIGYGEFPVMFSTEIPLIAPTV